MLLCASYCIRLLRLQFYDFSVNYEGLLCTIEPFDGTNFPKRNKEVHAVLKVLDLDYALYEDKTVNPSISTENHNEQLREYNSKLEKWQKSNEFAKLVIKHSISDAIRGAFPYMKGDRELSVKEFMNSIEESSKVNYSNFLINKLSTSRYDWHNGLSIHIKSMYNMAAELKALGRFISDDLLVPYLMASLLENYNKRAQNVDTPVRYKLCESLHQVQRKDNKVVS